MFVFLVLGMDPSDSHVLGVRSTSEPRPGWFVLYAWCFELVLIKVPMGCGQEGLGGSRSHMPWLQRWMWTEGSGYFHPFHGEGIFERPVRRTRVEGRGHQVCPRPSPQVLCDLQCPMQCVASAAQLGAGTAGSQGTQAGQLQSGLC